VQYSTNSYMVGKGKEMTKKDWTFTEEQTDAVCKGEVCPKCQSGNIKCVGSVPDGINNNFAYDCKECGEQWEGY